MLMWKATNRRRLGKPLSEIHQRGLQGLMIEEHNHPMPEVERGVESAA